ncbi:extracellular solute-binding protein [Paenibacillus senegalensis]|uniref:extracellular solute-binding protein n=1 Tax=Paenibacillus senegalensis TaxID=1465766 RepID=UPI000289E719|nr:extracellular solute-binding protein [Paenibacillus senegalensis]
MAVYPVRFVFGLAVWGGLVLLTTSCWWDAVKRPASPHEAGEDQSNQLHIVINSMGLSFPEGFDENNNPYLDYIEKHTGLEIMVTLPPLEGYTDKLNLIMSSGQLPDMINTSDTALFANYVKQNLLMPLDDYLEEYGPELKRLIPEEAWSQVRVDGKIYAVPSLNEVQGTELIYARKDWLDRLQLDIPTTLEEYVDVMRAFAEQDPDGNGLDDTFGLSVTENLGRTAPFFGAFGTQKDAWYERDGVLVYSGILPETRQALEFLSRLYKEGLLDPQFPLNKQRNLEDKVIDGRVGLYSAAWFDTRNPIEKNVRQDPQAQWIPLPYPVGPGGHSGTYSTSLVRTYNIVPAASTNPAGVIRLLNFIAGEGQLTLKLGFENEVWSMDNGRMVSDFQEHNRQQYRGIYGALADVINPEIGKARLDSLGEHFRLWDNIQMIHQHLIRNQFEAAPTPAMGKYNAKLRKMQDETFIKIVVGTYPLDKFDEFVEWWRAEGGDEITAEVNEWYRAKVEE